MVYQRVVRNGLGPPPSKSASKMANTSKTSVADSSSNGHVRVVVRVRPENAAEANENFNVVVKTLDEHMLIFDPKDEGSPDFYHGKRRRRDLNKRKKKDMRFAFDRVFGQEATSKEVYEGTTLGILDGLLDGFNCSVFAYGATGAGKTHTMLGNKACPGVIFQTMMDLYRRMDEIKENKTCDVAVSYLEVYNEQIRDLLVPGAFLPIREDPQKGVVITGLSLHKPRNAEELLHMLEFGNKNRTQHPTDANKESSRSHAVFQVFVQQRDRTANISTNLRVAKMSLIDLAGSERATVTTNRGARFREGANINRSLLALGNCINALAEGKKKGFIPYRNSKLTRLLKDSLGGNCRTVMIAAISPSSMTFEDTYNTLKYANRAKDIKADLKRNVVSVDFHISKYVAIVDELRKEVTELREKLRLYEEGGMVDQNKNSTPAVTQDTGQHDRLKGDLKVVFDGRQSIRQEMMEFEGSERDLTLKIFRKRVCLKRVALISMDPAYSSKASERLCRVISAAQKRQNEVALRKNATLERMRENTAKLLQVEQDIHSARDAGKAVEHVENALRTHHMEVELSDTRRQVRFLKKLCRTQQHEAKASEKLVSCLLRTVRRQYLVLKGHGLSTADMAAQVEVVQRLVEGERGVLWADQTLEDPADPATLAADDDSLDMDKLLDFPVLRIQEGDSAALGGGSALAPETSDPVGAPRPQSQPLASSAGATLPRAPGTPVRQRDGNPPDSRLVPALTTQPHGSLNSSLVAMPTTTSSASLGGQCQHAEVRACRLPSAAAQAALDDWTRTGSAACAAATERKPLAGCDVHARADTYPAPRLTTNQLTPRGAVVTVTREPLAHGGDETFTLEDEVSPLSPPLRPMPLHVSMSLCETPSNDHVAVNPALGGTVTKSQPHALGGTVTKGPAPVLGGTVTKAGPTALVDDKTVTRPPPVCGGTVTKEVAPGNGVCGRSIVGMDTKRSVVRSMNFADENPPSPAGKMTFAEAVKSPGKALQLRAGLGEGFSPRSPLASRDNFPDAPSAVVSLASRFDADSELPTKQRRVTFAANDAVPLPAGGRVRGRAGRQPLPASTSKVPGPSTALRRAISFSEAQTRDSLHRFGLPSTQDMRSLRRGGDASSQKSRGGGGGGRPRYMQSTKAAVNRELYTGASHRRTRSTEAGHRQPVSALPRRTPAGHQDHSALKPQTTRSRSQGSSHRKPLV